MQSQTVSKAMPEGGNRYEMALELVYRAENLRKSV